MNNTPDQQPLVLYGNDLSQPTRAIQWFCKLNSIPIQFKPVRLDKGEHKSPSFLQMNPNGKIPLLQHGQSFYLFESQAIFHFLRRLFPKQVSSQWYPEHTENRSLLHQIARIDSYLNWHGNHFRPGVAGFVFTKFMGPRFFGKSFSEEQVAIAKTTCIDVLKQLNDYWLEDCSAGYVAGSHLPSICDLFCYSEIAQLVFVIIERKDDNVVVNLSHYSFFAQFDRVVKWMERMEKLEHFQAIHNTLFKLAPRILNSKL